MWYGEPAQSRRTTPPLCSGRARTTAGDLPPPLGALCPRKGYPSGKDERLASHPGELRRLSRLNEAAILNLGTGGVPHSLPAVCLTGSVQLRGQQRGATATDGRQLGLGAYSYGLAPHSLAQ